MAMLIKTTRDGRRLEVSGLAVTLDGRLESFDLIEVKAHPRRREILEAEPAATHMAGRVALTREEAERVHAAFAATEARILASPRAIEERFRLAALRRTCADGIE